MGLDRVGLFSSGSAVFTVVSAVVADTVVSAEVWVVVTASVVVDVVVSGFAVVEDTCAAVVSETVLVAGGAVGGVVSGTSAVKAVSGSAVISGEVSGTVELVSEDSSVLGKFSEELEGAAVSVSFSFDIVVRAAVSLVRSAVGSADTDKLSDISAVPGAEEQAADKIEITADKIITISFFNSLFITINPFLFLYAFFKN